MYMYGSAYKYIIVALNKLFIKQSSNYLYAKLLSVSGMFFEAIKRIITPVEEIVCVAVYNKCTLYNHPMLCKQDERL